MHQANRPAILLFLLTALSLLPQASRACGGFFCTTVPINQAGEQIVFHQQDNEITAMVRILYAGEAEDFSWVVPVPTTPAISLGSDTTFNELELSTRPQFNLQQEGQVCEKDRLAFAPTAPGSSGGAVDEADGGVTIEEQLIVGAFDIDIVSSDNPDDMALWLQDNNYLLTDRGRDLIEPYVTAGMKFVALKLRSGEQTGSIQPLIMKYQSIQPMVPIRLTAIAAQDDMGVLVWVVNNARAVPENYEHVIPNYSKLDWYSGSFNAYNSYLSLITDAMNEAGGQGFATDYAGGITSTIRNSLTQTTDIQLVLNSLDNIGGDAQYITESLFQSPDPALTLASLQSILPLSGEGNTNLYFNPDELSAVYTADELRAARIALREAIVERQLEPIGNGVELLPQSAYLTRLYTTLSADEMTLDPVFTYNAQMPEQAIAREARLQASCTANVSEWSLTLGKGTNRENEVVIRAVDQPIPIFNVPIALDDQPAAFARQRTSADAAPQLLFEATASTIDIAADGSVSGGSMISASSDNDSGFLGAFGPVLMLVGSTILFTRRRL